MEDRLKKLFAGQLSRGELILFTGAGFSLAAPTVDGETVPSVNKLKEELWGIGFPDNKFEPQERLGDIFDGALRTRRTAVHDLFRRVFSISPEGLPTFYKTWFEMPWRRVYTLNIDDLPEAVNRLWSLPVAVRTVSALSDETLPAGTSLLCIHLNGKLSDFPNVTFSQSQYGERLTTPNVFYQTLAAELSSHPVVFVGTELDEPPLWQHLALRGRKVGREQRPRSYLVTPSLSAARRRALWELNVELLEMTAEEFADSVLGDMGVQADAGHQVLAELRGVHKSRFALQSVADLRSESRPDLAEYLMGREPSWADVTVGFAVKRIFEDGLALSVIERQHRLWMITGTAGTGKSTALMRLGLEVQAAGLDARWLNVETEVPLSRLREELRRQVPDIMLIDDLDVFGQSAVPFIRQLLDEHKGLRLACALRSNRAARLDIHQSLDGIDWTELGARHLEDDDIGLLIDALTRANRLGKLRGKTREEQEAVFRARAGRQLLVAMIEATSDQRFEEKVDSECRDLPRTEQIVYGIIALATRMRAFLERDEVLIAGGEDRSQTLSDLESLVRQHLVIREDHRRLRVRHRVIAERVVAYFRERGELAPIVQGLLFMVATKVSPGHSRRSREHRMLVTLLNHQFLQDELRDIERVRETYDQVEASLSWDYHYWLQRGSLEVEIGNLRLAENFLQQARGLAPDDYKVQTEWAYMLLKRAAQEAERGDALAREHAEQAFVELHDAIDRRGDHDAYPFHILGSQGLSYVRRAAMNLDEKTDLLRSLLGTVKKGRALHPSVTYLRELEEDLQREYLGLAMPNG